MNHTIKIISGGQTGADIGGLLAAEKLGIPTTGTAPKGFRTEDGKNPDLKVRFGLSESSSTNYKIRTEINVRDSDATIIYATDQKSSGTKLTVKFCKSQKKNYVLIHPDEPLSVLKTKVFITNTLKRFNRDVCINIAGNRESISKGIRDKVIDILTKAIELINEEKEKGQS